MDFIDIVLRLVGVFYALGAFLAIRSLAISELLDRAIGMIGMKPEAPGAATRRRLLGATAVLTGTSGTALALLSVWAVPLFVVNLGAQIIWLGWAARAFPPADAEERAGRGRTRNAAIGWCAMTLAVAWAWSDSRLAPAGDALAALIVLAAAAGYGIWLRRSLDPRIMTAAPSGPEKRPGRLRVSLLSEESLLSDADTGEPLSLHSCLPTELAYRFDAWDDDLFDAGGLDHPDGRPRFPTPEAADAHWREGLEIAAEMEGYFGKGKVEWVPGGPPGYPRPDGPE